MRKIFLAGIAAMAIGSVHAEPNDIRITAQNGYWSNATGYSEANRPMCSMQETGDNRYLFVKWFDGDDHLSIHIMKNSWKIPSGTRMNVSIQIDHAAPFIANAIGDKDLIQFTIRGDDLKNFLDEIRFGNSMTINFIDGNEGAWSANLLGGNQAVINLMKCIAEIKSWREQTTQPYNRPSTISPTQPFGSSGKRT